jgi:outer membrane receptor for ferrienterochelin and colicin
VVNIDNEKNTQTGLSAFYGKSWRGGNSSNITLSYSGLNANFQRNQQVVRNDNGKVVVDRNEMVENEIEEFKVFQENKILLSGIHSLEAGVGYIRNQTGLKEDSVGLELIDQIIESGRINAYVQDNIFIGNNFNIKAGLRADYSVDLSKTYFQPRLSASYRAGEFFKFNTSWGMYNQFIVKSSMVDELGNYRYLWTACDNNDIPVLEGRHYVAGITFNKSGFLFSVEGFNKTTDGLTRFLRNRKTGDKLISTGDSKSSGIDFFLKKDIKKHSAWVAYTLSKTEEHFSYFADDNEYRRAAHDQKHEVKFAALVNLSPFYLSANYVYGSGFPDTTPNANDGDTEDIAYKRFDASFIYRLSKKKFNLETGISVLNVFDTQNLKYSNFVKIPGDQTNSINIHAEAMPFTPTLFLRLSL